MLDIKKIRENPEAVKAALLKRMGEVDLSELLSLDQTRRDLIGKVEQLKAKKNQANLEVAQAKALKKETTEIFELMKVVSTEIKALDHQGAEVDLKIKEILSALPNLPADDVTAGGKENNQVIRSWGEKPHFKFESKHHIDLATQLDLVDYPRGAKLSGNGFWIYRGDGALLEWSLLNYFVEEHLRDGYTFILPPHVLNYDCGYVSGQFPKFVNDVFYLKDSGEQSQFLLPTAETALVNLHRDEILSEESLPRKYFAYTPCFRREAGSYRAQERGMIRGHQFNKVELFQYCRPEDSEKALQEMIEKSEKIVRGLGLHYQVSKLAAQDCSAAMGKTFDLEVWIPSMGEYKEVSSASNGYDYQARRGEIRFRRAENRKTEFLHTLNASGLATSRLFPAILEYYQQSDGSVRVPEVLKKWMNKDFIRV